MGGAVMQSASSPAPEPGQGYCHEAFLYDGMDEFLTGTLNFIGAATQICEPVLVVVSAVKINALRDGLNGSAEHVTFADMDEVGGNPGRIISAWENYLTGSQAGRVHGIGEPIWAGRPDDELVECQQHEALLNLAFRGREFRLMCPYDTSTLSEAVVTEALRTHPMVFHGGGSTQSREYPGDQAFTEPCRIPLPPAPHWAPRLEFSRSGDLARIRQLVAHFGASAGLNNEQLDGAVLAANEMATNSLRHGGRHGTIQVWWTPDSFISEISDNGIIHEPLVGRLQPTASDTGGRGFWLANRLCDLVQLRVFDSGNVVRLHSRRGANH
jgi:anti-sigma regulatory factor (Ser/Thr protein kinase)